MTSYRRHDQDRSDRRRRGVPLSDLDPALTDVSRRVIGCAIEVHKALGPGYDKSVYAAALGKALKVEGVEFQTGHSFDVEYEGDKVGTIAVDLYVAERFAVNLMAYHGEVGSMERSQLRAALRSGDMELGLIINFGERRLKDGLVRVLNPDKIESLRRDDEYEDDEEEDEDDES